MEFYSATKENEILLSTGKWMELETIILSEVVQVQKDKGFMFSYIYMEDRSNTNTSIIIHSYKYT
jgi:hypothetical protein